MHSQQTSSRLLALDAFRGFIMLLMASSSLGIPQMAKAYPDSWWAAIAPQFEHREWTGCALWDLIQPAFMFMVGMAVPYSYAKRRQQGQGFFGMSWHALSRSILLILLGVMLSTHGKDKQTIWIFTNVLAQIGLGYTFLFLLWRLGSEYEVSAIILILVGYWIWFFLHPVPAADYDFAAMGANQADLLPNHFAHWSKNLNAAADFDRWFLNLFPRSEPWVSHPGGYHTLNFVPSLATMLGGSLTGQFLQRSRRTDKGKVAVLLSAGLVCILLGTVLGIVACPVVKRIWTPSWVFFSGGWVLILLAAFYWIVEVWNMDWLTFPFVVVGMNSIFIYVLHSTAAGWIRENLRIHLGPELFSGYLGPVMERVGVLAVLWLLCWWLYRQRAFLRL